MKKDQGALAEMIIKQEIAVGKYSYIYNVMVGMEPRILKKVHIQSVHHLVQELGNVR